MNQQRHEDGGHWLKLWHTPGVIQRATANDPLYPSCFQVNLSVFHPAVSHSYPYRIVGTSDEDCKQQFIQPSSASSSPFNIDASVMRHRDLRAFRLRNSLNFEESRAAALAFLLVWNRLRDSTFHAIVPDMALRIARMVYDSYQYWKN